MRMKRLFAAALASGTAVTLLAGCAGGGAGSEAVNAGDRPAWCGDTEAVIGFADGYGSNSWKRLNRAELEDELSKCPSVTDFIYSDAQGDTQKAISDINSLASQGANGILAFPDAGEAILPALRSAYKSDIAVVPYRVSPGGEAGRDYTTFVASDFEEIGRLWAKWLVDSLPDGGNVLFLGGPPANSQNMQVYAGLQEILKDHPGIKFIGEEPFTPTDWNPAKTQEVTATMLSRYPKIDAVVADFAATSILSAFEQAGRPIPLIATADVNGLSCQYDKLKPGNPDFELFTVNSQTSMVRLAAQHVVAEATGGTAPAETTDVPFVFEDSVTGKPNPPKCDANLPEDALLSSSLGTEKIAEVLK